VAVSFFQ